jgi:hypothetical protein
MTKTILSLALLSSLSLHAEGFYAGVDFQAGSGKHEITVDDVAVANSDSISVSSLGVHVGYTIIPNGSVELSYGALSLEDDDVTRIGVDYIQTFPIGALSPYAGVGLATNSMSDANIETGLGGRLRFGAYYEIMPNLNLGAELNYNYISWKSETDNLGQDWELSSSYYGLGFNVNYKF